MDGTEYLSKLLLNGSADLIGVFLDRSIVFSKEFELSIPIYFSETKFVVSEADMSMSGIFDFFTVYDVFIWIGIFSVLILVLLIIFVVTYRIKCLKTKTPEHNATIWELIRLQLFQYNFLYSKFVSGNFLILMFAFLQCGLIIRMYANEIRTQIVKTVDPAPFKEYELLQILKEGKYKLIIQAKNRWWYQDILHSGVTAFQNIKRATKNNPILLASEMMDPDDDPDVYVMEKVKNGKYITIQSQKGALVSLWQGYCDMVYMKTNFPPKEQSIVMRRGHPLMKKINKIIKEDVVTIKRIFDKYYDYTRPPKCHENRKEGPKALNLTPFIGVFVVFGAGTILATMALFFELFWIKKRRK